MRIERPEHEQVAEGGRGLRQTISGARGFLSVLLLAGSVSVGGVATEGCASGTRISNPSPNVVAKLHQENREKWWFMDEAQKESAQRMMSLPCGHIEELLCQSGAIQIPLILPVVQAAVEVQEALLSNDPRAIREKSEQFYTVAMAMGEGESQRKFREFQEDPNAAMELMMFQDYFIPAPEHVQRLSAIKSCVKAK